MKLVINIPCYNEAKTLPLVVESIPNKIDGISSIEVQVVDDGSHDNTSGIAKSLGCVVIKHKRNRGLGRAFKTGVDAALSRGCDIFVNTDADNQYPSIDIPRLVKPILTKEADIVIGNRKPWNIKHFSNVKRFFQFWGNRLARAIAGTNVPDTVSGFRAYSKDSLMRLNVTTKFSYVLDTIVQASKKGLKIVSVPVKTNKPTRKSRLFRNIFHHMRMSLANILRIYVLYEPFRTFLYFSLVFLIPGSVLILRFLYHYIVTLGSVGKIQSLVIASVFLIISALMFTLGVLAELIGNNRKLIEESLYLQKKEKYK